MMLNVASIGKKKFRFLISMSLQPDGVKFLYLKLILVNPTEFSKI